MPPTASRTDLYITTPDGATRPAIADEHGSHAAMTKMTLAAELHAVVHIAGVDGMRALLVKARDEIVNTGDTACRQSGLVGTRECDCALCELTAAIEHIDTLDGEGLQRLSPAATDVLGERQRQVEQEGWTPEHDDAHHPGELAAAGACYSTWAAEVAANGGSHTAHRYVPGTWPWSGNWWKPKNVRRDLVRAGALILAEIERLDRLAGAQAPEGDTDAAALSSADVDDGAALTEAQRFAGGLGLD